MSNTERMAMPLGEKSGETNWMLGVSFELAGRIPNDKFEAYCDFIEEGPKLIFYVALISADKMDLVYYFDMSSLVDGNDVMKRLVKDRAEAVRLNHQGMQNILTIVERAVRMKYSGPMVTAQR